MCSYDSMTIRSVNICIFRPKTLLNATKIALALLCIASPSITFAYDFTLSASGPNHVVVGHDLYIEEVAAITDGTRDYAYHFVDGLPDGATPSWPEIAVHNWTPSNMDWKPQNTMLKINVPSTVPASTYALTIRVQSGGVTHQFPYKMVVDPVPAPLPKQVIGSIPPIPDLAAWQSQMTSYGKQLCNEANIVNNSLWEGNSWFYDGIRVYYQIADYTGDNSWNACAGYVKEVYKPYVLSTTTQGWRVFPHGLYQDYLRNSDPSSKAATLWLSTNSAYAGTGGAPVSFGTSGRQRETSYMIHAYRIAGLLGSPNLQMYVRSVDFVLGMIDQLYISKTDPYLQPFMTGLMMEALIQYYQDPQAPFPNDPRVPPAIKAAADGLWAQAQMPNPNGGGVTFFYESTGNPLKAAPDLNLLIAPAYAWLYKITGNPVYQQEGDLIFQGGVEGAWLPQGKQFNQNYRWSFDYVNWRMHPDITPPTPPSSLQIIP